MAAPRRRGLRGAHAGRHSVAEYVVAVAAVVAMAAALVVTFVPSALDAITPTASPPAESESPSDGPSYPPSSPETEDPTASASAGPSAPVLPTAPTSPAPSTSLTPPSVTFPSVRRLDRLMAQRGMARVPRSAWEGATFNVASFNVLGASHTRGPNRRKNYAGAEQRLPGQLEMLDAKGITVAGLQEFQSPQVEALRARTGDAWGVFPGVRLGVRLADNSIIWRTEHWEEVETHTVEVPYFRGKMTPMPYVLLEHRASGRRVWFANFHNPANVVGDAAHLRAQGLQIEADLAKRLSADGTPVVVTGDMNDREAFGCPFATASGMHSPNGVMIRDSVCVRPPHLDVDWIFGTRDLAFSAFESDGRAKDRRLTDHPLITATATLAGVEERRGCRPRISRDGVVWYCRPAG